MTKQLYISRLPKEEHSIEIDWKAFRGYLVVYPFTNDLAKKESYLAFIHKMIEKGLQLPIESFVIVEEQIFRNIRIRGFKEYYGLQVAIFLGVVPSGVGLNANLAKYVPTVIADTTYMQTDMPDVLMPSEALKRQFWNALVSIFKS